jgi:hypothetical protein
MLQARVGLEPDPRARCEAAHTLGDASALGEAHRVIG